MAKDIFISYSRRDQEFVTRLASDLNERVAGVWFDQSAIRVGQKWHDEIVEGIRECKAFILVLSPDAMESPYVHEEVNEALELGKTIFPVIYRPAKWAGKFETLVRDIQSLDLRSGSYTDSFQKLVDGLIEAGAGQAAGERPFLRQPSKIPLNIVFNKIPGWGLAWSLGWLGLWTIALGIFFFLAASMVNLHGNDISGFIIILAGAGIGGFSGGLSAGLFTMLALRRYAPSISWKHMSPTIRIWGISAFGLILSFLTIYLNVQGVVYCKDVNLGECLGQSIAVMLAGPMSLILLSLIFVIVGWFPTGMLAGWQAVRHIRSLEPGITTRQGWSVSTGWGCGAIVAAIVMIFLITVFSTAFRL